MAAPRRTPRLLLGVVLAVLAWSAVAPYAFDTWLMALLGAGSAVALLSRSHDRQLVSGPAAVGVSFTTVPRPVGWT